MCMITYIYIPNVVVIPMAAGDRSHIVWPGWHWLDKFFNYFTQISFSESNVGLKMSGRQAVNINKQTQQGSSNYIPCVWQTLMPHVHSNDIMQLKILKDLYVSGIIYGLASTFIMWRLMLKYPISIV